MCHAIFVNRGKGGEDITVEPLLSGNLLSGHPPLSGHFLKSQIISVSLKLQYSIPLLNGQPLLSGQLSKSRGWPLNRGPTVYI